MEMFSAGMQQTGEVLAPAQQLQVVRPQWTAPQPTQMQGMDFVRTASLPSMQSLMDNQVQRPGSFTILGTVLIASMQNTTAIGGISRSMMFQGGTGSAAGPGSGAGGTM